MKVRYMVLHAYGMGGTIRTIINQANAMAAAGHDVELVSVVRTRDTPFFAVDPRVRTVALVDRRTAGTDEPPGRRSPGARRWPGTHWWRGVRWHGWRPGAPRASDTQPGTVVPRDEVAAHDFTRGVERAVVTYLRGLRGGVLVTSRPALNILAARYARPGVVKVGQEHVLLARHRGDLRRAIEQYYPRLDAMVVLTRKDKADYRKLLRGSATRVVRIPNAVHALGQQRSDLDRPVVVAAGRLTRQKGFDLLVPAFDDVVRRHPDWQLRIFGSGREEAKLRGMIEQRGLTGHVHLMGRSQNLDEELAQASMYVMSSRFEGFGMVLIEAMAHGVPTVSFNCPYGPADVVDNEVNGLLVPPKDVNALAESIERLVEDETLRHKLGAGALETAARYGPESVTPRWEKLFRRLRTTKRRSRLPAGTWRRLPLRAAARWLGASQVRRLRSG